MHRIHLGILSLFLASAAPISEARAAAPGDVLTWHGDPARTGANTHETVLTPAVVNKDTFGLLFRLPVDGFQYAQPLSLSGVSIPGRGVHNVVFAATEHDSVYAFDADTNEGPDAAPLWKTSLIEPGAGVSTVLISDYGLADPPATEFGVTGTPVIDPATGTLYVVGQFKDVSGGAPVFYHKLFALDVSTGAIKQPPVVISATVNGVSFISFYQFQRPGLALVNGVLYIGFSSVGDLGPYHGWMLGYDAATLKQVSAWVDTPTGYMGGIWMGGAAPAFDSEGNLFLVTGNGTFDANAGGSNYGDSLVKLQTRNGLSLTDSFTPTDQALLASVDGDFGSGGVMVLPDDAGSAAHPHLAVACGKDATIFLLDRDHLGGFSPVDNQGALQAFLTANSSYGSPAYFNHTVYYTVCRDVLRAFSLAGAVMSPSPVAQAPDYVGYPGATPCVSANGADDAIVWIVDTSGFPASQPAILRAYDPNNLDQELYDSSASGARDLPGIGMKFATPIISHGKVYVGTDSSVAVFGLFPPPKLSVASPGRISVSGLPGVQYVIQAADSIDGAPGAWKPIGTMRMNAPTQTIDDLEATGAEQRFYRGFVGPP